MHSPRNVWSRTRLRFVVCVLVLASVAQPRVAVAQGRAADYDRADELRERFRGLVDRQPTDIEWLDEERLWYHVSTRADGRDVVLVDVARDRGERRRVLFTDDAAAPSDGVEAASVARLALVAGDRSRIAVLLRSGVHGVLDLADGSFEPSAESLPPAFRIDVEPAESKPRRSRSGGRRSGFAVHNESSVPLQLRWIGTDGQRHGYGTVGPGGRMRQGTFEGHAFVLTGEDGRDRCWFRAGRRYGIAHVTDDSWTGGPARLRGGPSKAKRPYPERRRRQGISPDGAFRVTSRDGDLWIEATAEGGGESQVTRDAGEHLGYDARVRWAPDSRSFVTLRTARPAKRRVHLVESAPRDSTGPELHSLDYVKPGDPIDRPEVRFFRVRQDPLGVDPIEIEGSELFDTPYWIQRLRWDEDGTRFTFLYNERGHRIMRWIAVDAVTARASVVIDEAPDTFFDYAHKRHLHEVTPRESKPEQERVVWMSERSGWNHLYLIDANTGDVVHPVTSGEWVVRDVERVDDAGHTMYLEVMGIDPDQDPYHVHYARVDVDTGELTRLTYADGTHAIEFSPDRAHYVATWSRVDHPPVTELRRTSDGSLVTTLERADASRLEGAGWRAPERFVAKGRDGEIDIYGIAYRPSNFDPGASYPIIESIYAGPHGAHVPKSWRVHRRPAELAELGFIVVQIDGMGTNWRSKAFHDVAWKNLGDAGFPDRIAWMRAFGSHEPAVDLERVGVYGGSAGGQNAMRALIAHNDFYDAAVADCGCHDNRMDKIWWNELWMSWPIGPWYDESSNVVQAHRMEGSLLLIVGEIDRNVDPASTMQVVRALIDADKDFDLLVMPGVGHGAAETRYGTRRRRDFFVRELLGVEPRRP